MDHQCLAELTFNPNIPYLQTHH